MTFPFQRDSISQMLALLTKISNPDELIGNLGTIVPLTVTNQEVIVADVHRSSMKLSSPLCVTFYNKTDNDGPASVNFPTPQIRVRFGVDGLIADTGFIDVKRNQSFTVRGSHVRVSVRVTNVFGVPSPAELGAFISIGTPGLTQPLRTGVSSGSITAGGSATITIPNFVKYVTICPVTFATPYIVTLNMTTPAGIGSFIHNCVANELSILPIPANCYSITINNTGPAASIFSLIYDIDI